MSFAKFWTPPKSLAVFFTTALVLFLTLILLWMPVSKWTSYPTGWLTHLVLDQGARYWVRTVHTEPGRIEVETRIAIKMAGSNPNQGVAELVAEANPARYAYGLPLFLALLLASRGPRLLKKGLIGYLILLVPQTFSTVLEILRQIVVAGGRAGAMAVDQWQLEAVAMGYQVGSLLVPTLAPVVLWLWLERSFFQAVILDGWLRRAQELQNK